MSRSGYCDDLDNWSLICWRGAVSSAIKGKRGQAFLIELREAAAREADKAHKKAINNEALAAFVAGGMDESSARRAVTLIAQRKIPGVHIYY
ncbi:hypothetical protein ACEQOL_006537 [Pseudomonas aeruginosa]